MKHIILRGLSRLHYFLAFVTPQPGPRLARSLDSGMARFAR